jgi:hypothetical protein
MYYQIVKERGTKKKLQAIRCKLQAKTKSIAEQLVVSKYKMRGTHRRNMKHECGTVTIS